MAALPQDPSRPVELPENLCIKIGDEVIENVDTFVYLGYELDCMLDDKAHTSRLNTRLLKAACATGQILRDMHCANPFSLKKYFVTLVASQLYGSFFLDSGDLEWEKAVGIFVKSALCLPNSFPTCVCVSLLGLRPLCFKVMEARMKFLLKVEGKPGSPSFSALLYDREHLMPRGFGVNARLGDQLVKYDIVSTLDYRIHYSEILQATGRLSAVEHLTALLSSGGRAFWVEISEDGRLPFDLCSVMSTLQYEQVRIVVLFLADSLQWSAPKKIPCKCPTCETPLSSMHLFSCSCSFLSGQEWSVLMSLFKCASWQDAVDVIFAVLQKWVSETSIFKPSFTLNVLEYVPPVRSNPFRINTF
jgi:hypothetical protein